MSKVNNINYRKGIDDRALSNEEIKCLKNGGHLYRRIIAPKPPQEEINKMRKYLIEICGENLENINKLNYNKLKSMYDEMLIKYAV